MTISRRGLFGIAIGAVGGSSAASGSINAAPREPSRKQLYLSVPRMIEPPFWTDEELDVLRKQAPCFIVDNPIKGSDAVQWRFHRDTEDEP